MSIFEEILKRVVGRGSLIWKDGELPYYSNRGNINLSKDGHKRRILRAMVRGEKLTAKGYAEMPNGTTKFGTRFNEMEKETELPFTREWETNGKVRWLKYGLDFNKLKEIK